MSSPDSALPLADLNVSVSMHDDANLPDEQVLWHCDVANETVIQHLRQAKAALASLGVNLNWTENL